MIGLLLVSHGRLAHALLETATEIVGGFRAVESVAISRHEDLDEVEGKLREAVRRLDHGSGVLILVDMFGGTASNMALRLVGEAPIEVVTGCNLPMLLKVSSLLEDATDLQDLAQLLKFYGQRNVLVASELLKEREK